MKNRLLAFNIILAVASLILAGCKTSEEKKKNKEAAFLRLHLETNRDGTQHNAPVPIFRDRPVYVTVERTAALDEGFMSKVEIVDVDAHGGFALKITFNEEGKKRLDYLTTANKGRRLAVHCKWTEERWLAAPVITRRVSDGVFIFTPDASREECERIENGLKNVIKKLSKPYTF